MYSGVFFSFFQNTILHEKFLTKTQYNFYFKTRYKHENNKKFFK